MLHEPDHNQAGDVSLSRHGIVAALEAGIAAAAVKPPRCGSNRATGAAKHDHHSSAGLLAARRADHLSLGPARNRSRSRLQRQRPAQCAGPALWSEGPASNAQARYLVWSDIPTNRQLRWLEDDGRVTVFRNPSNTSNGNSFDFQGRQLACEHLTRRVVRYELDGSVTILADRFDGKAPQLTE